MQPVATGRRHRPRVPRTGHRLGGANGFDASILHNIRDQLDDLSCVPASVFLSGVCRSWRAAAAQPNTFSISFDSRQLDDSKGLGHWQHSFRFWLLKGAHQLHSFVVEHHGGRYAELFICAALRAAKDAAADSLAAGRPFPWHELQLPHANLRLDKSASLVAALPHLRRLSLPVSTWGQGGTSPAGDPFLAALGCLDHLTSLEIWLVGESGWRSSTVAQPCWEQLLEAAPKQLQQLSVRYQQGTQQWRSLLVGYTWAPLAAFPQLQQLRLDALYAKHPRRLLRKLPALTSLGLQWQGDNWQPLVEAQEVLRELQVGSVVGSNAEHLKQLTCLTSLSMHNGNALTSLPEQVASRLQHLDWGLWPSRGSSSSGRGAMRPQRLRHCSSSNLRNLQLRGWDWLQDGAAAEAVGRLAALTAFGLHAVASHPRAGMGGWEWLLPMRQLKQLRRLELPAPLLATGGAWLGGLPHLTSLRLAVTWLPFWHLEEVFGNRTAHAQVLSNLRSCWAGLKVLEVELTLSYSDGYDAPVPEALVPGVRALLRRQLPGVRLLLTWKVEWDAEGLDL